ncbi:MAG: beta-ketoacyl-ACP synthase II [Actinobacteria bacterium]|nr:beta-ketoacyl-ACP synthase II [Actinomycetota bacterium]
MKRRVVITGMAAITPYGMDLKQIWNNLINGISAIDYITSFDTKNLKVKIAGEVKDFDPNDFMEKKDVRRTARFAQMGLAAAKLAIEDAFLEKNLSDIERDDVGVVVGSAVGGIDSTEDAFKAMYKKGPHWISPFFSSSSLINMASFHVARNFKFRGPNVTPVTACSTGTQAVGMAALMIANREADVIIAGGAESVINEFGIAGFVASGAFSSRNDDPKGASRPFDKDRDGFVVSEGAGILVLENYERAINRGAKIYSEIIGFGNSSDALHITSPDPEGIGAAKAVKIALKMAKILPDEVDYINAHGTATRKNDPMETNAIKLVFKDYAYRVGISSTKSMLGHSFAATGAQEIIISSLAIRDNIIPPTINLNNPDPECDLDYTPNIARKRNIDVVVSNSFGFGGQNAAIVLKKFEE